MTTTTSIVTVVLCSTMAAGIGNVSAARAQTPATETSAPAMRAAGMALRDGALAPGMLTVRVVRGSFDSNAAGETVHIDVGGQTQQATTGADGRAQFVHLPIGSMVQATAVVDGEALVSERFEMAAESGIRVLLIAGEGDASAGGVVHPPVATPDAGVDPVGTAAAPASVAPGGDESAVAGIRVAFAMATAVALGLVVFGKYRWRPWRLRNTGRAHAD